MKNTYKQELQAVKNVIKEIQKQSSGFMTYDKPSDYKQDDHVTSADYAAQQIYTTMLAKYSPDAGIIAEENGLRQEPSNKSNIYYTIDPLDGTNAFVRKQSDGIGTLFAKIDVTRKQIIAAYVGDAMTGEIYYYHENTDKVIRSNLRSNYQDQILSYQTRIKKRILSLDDIREFPERADRITKPKGYRDNMGVSNGSIGTNMAKLRKGEVDAILLKPGIRHPRDESPCIGISAKMGYVSIYIDNGKISEVVDMKHDITINSRNMSYQLIVHQAELSEVLNLFK